MWYNLSEKMFTGMAKPNRTVGYPDNQRAGKWSCTVLDSLLYYAETRLVCTISNTNILHSQQHQQIAQSATLTYSYLPYVAVHKANN